MVLNRFCCCCDLRRGSIVFAWLQMMQVAITITILIGTSDMLTLIVQASIPAIAQDSDQRYYAATAAYSTASITMVLKVWVGLMFIKGVSCIGLTWGLVKKCHLFYQPWLFISGIEAAIGSIGVLITFILACIFAPELFSIVLLDGAFTALYWYLWFCIYTVYKLDMKPSAVSYELNYDTISDAHPTIL